MENIHTNNWKMQQEKSSFSCLNFSQLEINFSLLNKILAKKNVLFICNVIIILYY